MAKPKDKKMRRSHHIGITITADERALLERESQATGVTMSTITRQALRAHLDGTALADWISQITHKK